MAFQGDSIYWVEVEKVVPNPFQPRREFNEGKLQELAESIRMYGVLQPLTVTRNEVQNVENGTFYTEYELIAGERRLRASRLAGVAQVPVIIREGEQSEQEKLELAIIENLQREDLNAVDRALAFQQLAEQFKMNHAQVARKVGRSREYVANSIRLLKLPEFMQLALQKGDLGEGHARTLLMLTDRPAEQETIFREILLKKMSVREVERIVRKIATDKVRKPNKNDIDDHLIEIEKEFTETLGTRVQIQKTDFGGKLTIDYFSEDDLSALLERVRLETANATPIMKSDTQMKEIVQAVPVELTPPVSVIVPPLINPATPLTSIPEPESILTQAHTTPPVAVQPQEVFAHQVPEIPEVPKFISPVPEAVQTPAVYTSPEIVSEPEYSHPVIAPAVQVPPVPTYVETGEQPEVDLPVVEDKVETENEPTEEMYSIRNFNV